MTILNQEEPAHAAAAARLRTEPIIWLTTVARSGKPQSTPVWFLWEAGEFLIYGLANGPKTRNIGSNPYVSLHLEGNGRGGANVIFEGTARIDPAGPRADAVPAYIEKYREFIDSYGWTPESFATDYPYVIRVSPDARTDLVTANPASIETTQNARREGLGSQVEAMGLGSQACPEPSPAGAVLA